MDCCIFKKCSGCVNSDLKWRHFHDKDHLRCLSGHAVQIPYNRWVICDCHNLKCIKTFRTYLFEYYLPLESLMKYENYFIICPYHNEKRSLKFMKNDVGK